MTVEEEATATPAGAQRVALCILTYQRPHGLAATLDACAALRVPDGWSVDLVVVDNDPEESARAVVDDARSRGVAVRYAAEHQRGIPFARNRAVAEASGATWLAFVDDDESPRPEWLEHIVEAQAVSGADVVLGPSVPTFDVEPPAWIRRGGFFERRGVAGADGPGAEIPYWYARTSGVLIRTDSITNLGPRPFDERLAASGGSDRALFESLAAAGARLAWAPDAVVVERVPGSRASLWWLLRRHFRIGNQRSLALVDAGASVPRRVLRAGRGARDVVVHLAVAAVRGPAERRVAALQRAACGAGLVAGAAGFVYQEYRRTHGA